jgi:N-carbamoyl-L-amino-acid hydrolase
VQGSQFHGLLIHQVGGFGVDGESMPRTGGEYDGALGVASALVAVDLLKTRGFRPRGPLAIAVFPEEEGSRFGVACLGSRLLTGALDPNKARNLKDADGNTYADVAATNGQDPRLIGADHKTLGQLGVFVELHVEQGRGLADLGQPVAIGSSIWATDGGNSQCGARATTPEPPS